MLCDEIEPGARSAVVVVQPDDYLEALHRLSQLVLTEEGVAQRPVGERIIRVERKRGPGDDRRPPRISLIHQSPDRHERPTRPTLSRWLRLMLSSERVRLEKQTRPGNRPVPDIRRNHRAKAPPFQVRALRLFVQDDPMTGTAEAKPEIDILDGRPGEPFGIEATEGFEDLQSDGPTAVEASTPAR